MYKNIGNKIQILAQTLGILGMIGAVIAGIVVIVVTEEAWGAVILILGPLASWISSWFMYGFGVLIEKTSIIARNTCGEAQNDIYYDEDESYKNI